MIAFASSQLWVLSAVMLLAFVSPGPDFVAVVSFALGGRRGGIGVALGVALASLAWAAFAMAGLSLVLTRLGWHSTMVLTGDPDQSDLLPGMSGLAQVGEKLDALEDIAVIRLADRDIVRHPLVASMLTVL